MSIKKNEDGTYEVVLSIAEGVNRSGMLIKREIMEREIKRFNETPWPLISELGYPTELSHEYSEPSSRAMVLHARLLDLHLDRACGYLSDFKIQEGTPAMVVGTFTPAGAYHDAAIDLIDKKIPVKFGMRALGRPTQRDGIQIMQIEKIITWDLIQGDQP